MDQDLCIFACMASSLDGKIGPANVDRFVSITSRRDLEHLKSIRDQADGILFGAETFRTWPKVHRGHSEDHHPRHFILSRSLDLDFTAPLFQDPRIQITLFSPTATQNLELPENVRLVRLPEGERQMDLILTHIKSLGIRNLMVEGGGRILNQFLAAGALQELYLTVSPMVIGDPQAPGLLGSTSLPTPVRFSVLSQEIHDSEVYLHLRVDY